MKPVLALILLTCLGCSVNKQTIKVGVTDTPNKANGEVVTASYEVELK
jgi:hypothetical protein